MKLKQTEHQIQDAIIETLRLKKWFVWRHNSGMMFGNYKGKPWAVKLGVAGLPDLFALKDGRLVGIEVKRPGQKATEVQENMLIELQKHGAEAFVVHSVEETLERLQKIESIKL